mgnify:CR=1 FL=1
MKLWKSFMRIQAAAAGQERFAKVVAVFALQAAVLLEPFDAVGVEHLAPDIAVVAGRVTAGKGMREIGSAIARRHAARNRPRLSSARSLRKRERR